MIDIRPLRYFVTLAETGHFGRAAARLHLSQPPLSRQLASLEAGLGVALIERGPRTFALTAAGERFYADAKAILKSVEQAAGNARAAARGEAGSLAIGFTMCAAYSVAPGYARAFRAAYPGVNLALREAVSNDLAAQVLAGQLDAAIVLADVLPRGLTARTVVRDRLCVALPRRHRLAKAQRLKVGQLRDEPFVLAAATVAPTLHAAIIDVCRSAGFSPEVRFEVQLQQTVISLVGEGVGLALVPASMRKLQLSDVVFRDLVGAPRIDQQLIWAPTHRNPCLERFLELAH
ncbi:LysR family transcriptional regulator [Solimonas marina]|uniref:LysR family transcriptional regulator n=1 Tax=Solimonas marina TaxID=2714601 RepID=A0A969WEI6_9GAMM|nr:LysR family transcriptional regulator [Solimonas marina]